MKLGLKVTSISFNCKHFRESTILGGKLPKSFKLFLLNPNFDFTSPLDG